MHGSPISDRVIRRISLHTPNLYAANLALLGVHFFLRNKVLPHALSSDKAGLMDYIFWRSLVVGFNLTETYDLARAALEPAAAGGEGIVSSLVVGFILNEAYD